jgi:hypothetical protein
MPVFPFDGSPKHCFASMGCPGVSIGPIANGRIDWRVAFPGLLAICEMAFIVNSLQAAFGTAQSGTGLLRIFQADLVERVSDASHTDQYVPFPMKLNASINGIPSPRLLRESRISCPMTLVVSAAFAYVRLGKYTGIFLSDSKTSGS